MKLDYYEIDSPAARRGARNAPRPSARFVGLAFAWLCLARRRLRACRSSAFRLASAETRSSPRGSPPICRRGAVFQEGLLKGKRASSSPAAAPASARKSRRSTSRSAPKSGSAGRRGPVLDATAKELTAKHGGTVKTHSVDIRDAQAVDAMVQRIWDESGRSRDWSTTPPATSSARPRTSRRTASTPSPTSSSTARST